MAEIKTIWEEKVTVKSYETDFRNRWKPTRFFEVMQEAGTNHAAHLGVGYAAMMEKRMTWILTRTKIKFMHFPELHQSVIVRTWPKGIQQKIFYMRDFEFYQEDGTLLGLATSAWLIVDVDTRKMLSRPELQGGLPDNDGKYALNEPLEKILIPDVDGQGSVFQAGYSNVDMVGHVNNTRYIDWICDSFSYNTYQDSQIDWLQINYNHEVLPGERVRVLPLPPLEKSQPWLVQGKKLVDGLRSFDAAVKWN